MSVSVVGVLLALLVSALAITTPLGHKITHNWEVVEETSTAFRTEAKAKNLNGYIVAKMFSDPQCMTQENAIVFPLNKCIADVAGLTPNAFFIGTLDSNGRTRQQGYFDSSCREKGSPAPLSKFPPPSCMSNSDRSSNTFEYSPKAPYHPLGWTVNVFNNPQCTGSYVQEQFNTNCINTGPTSSQHLYCGNLGDGAGHQYSESHCTGGHMALGPLQPIVGQICVNFEDNGQASPYFKRQGCDGRAPVFDM